MKIASNGIELDVEEQGAGPAVVLVMGLGAQRILWPEGFRAALLERGLRVVSYDNRDVGGSTWLTAAGVPNVREALLRVMLGLPVRAPYTLSDMADDLAGLLDALGLQSAHVVGASMGGMIAQTFALRHPARLRSLTSIMSTPGGRRSLLRTRPSALGALLGKPPRSEEEASQRMLTLNRVIGSPGFERDEALLRELGAEAFRRGSNPPGFARQFTAILASGSRRAALREVRVPSLVVHGTADPLVHPSSGRATAAALPRSRLLELNGMGHDLPRGVWRPLADAIASLVRSAEPS